MLKSLSILALTGILTVPALAMAGSSGATQAELEQRIEELSRQLDELKAEMSKQKEVVNEYVDTVDTLDERSEAWDLASRFELSAEFRSRGDFYRAKNVFSAGTPLGMTGMDAATGMPIFGGVSKGDQENDTILTNRLRLNMKVDATENLEFVGRLAMYKAWGMQSTPTGLADGYPIFDGNTTRTPNDSALYVDRAYINWTEIAGLPIWLSVGRRPTTDGPPAQLRMNSDSRLHKVLPLLQASP